MRTMNLTRDVKFRRQFKQPFEEKELVAEIISTDDEISISIEKANPTAMKRLSDELVECMMCADSEYKNSVVTMYCPDWGMFDAKELLSFVNEFMKEYNITLTIKTNLQ